jgi:hypothetical protein
MDLPPLETHHSDRPSSIPTACYVTILLQEANQHLIRQLRTLFFDAL